MAARLVTLNRRGHALASPVHQLRALDAVPLPSGRFDDALRGAGLFPLKPTRIDIFQLNLGRVCNQTCAHCHVDAGPDREESMSDAVLDACLRIFETQDIGAIDITGGAPEMHPRFREIVERAAAVPGRRVMHRCNLTAIMTRPMWDIGDLLAEKRVEIIASLPSFKALQTDAQRGDGIFDTSIACLQRLNALGYGHEGSGRVLNLVTNPVGAFLPGAQASLEREFKRQLQRRYGVVFDRLFVITNMPISRFLEFLFETGQLEEYLHRLATAFNPAAAAGVMCRNTVSVGWDGTLYDCDFNQMLELPVVSGAPRTIFDWDKAALEGRDIVVRDHCFGCTAGAGSSCGGETA
jgi:radical SAM/Cys-rich protein